MVQVSSSRFFLFVFEKGDPLQKWVLSNTCVLEWLVPRLSSRHLTWLDLLEWVFPSAATAGRPYSTEGGEITSSGGSFWTEGDTSGKSGSSSYPEVSTQSILTNSFLPEESSSWGSILFLENIPLLTRSHDYHIFSNFRDCLHPYFLCHVSELIDFLRSSWQ